jgi:hypothetical protein
MRLARKPLHAVTPIWQNSVPPAIRSSASSIRIQPVLVDARLHSWAPTEACVRCRLHSGFLGFEQDFLCELVLTHLSIGDLNGSVGLAIPRTYPAAQTSLVAREKIPHVYFVGNVKLASLILNWASCIALRFLSSQLAPNGQRFPMVA